MFQNFRNFQNIRVGATLGQGVGDPIVINGVSYHLLRDDLTRQPLKDPITNQPIYARRYDA